MDSRGTVLTGTDLWIEDGVIKDIGPELSAAEENARVIDARQLILYPGLVNTHHHLYQVLTRNLPGVQRLELFDWLKTLYQLWRGLDANLVYHAALIGLGELLKYGCTTCLDHHYIFPRGQSGLLEAEFEAARELGVRFHACRGSMSLGEAQGGLPPDDLVQTTGEILEDSARIIEKYHDPAPYSLRQVVLAPCSPFSVTPELLRESASLARSFQVRLHTHLAETKDEEEFCLKAYGKRPLALMEDLNWVGPDVWYAHGIHFNEAELKVLAQTGTGIAHCPVSNMKLASGVAPVTKMLALDIPVGLAVDGSASNDGSNLLAEIRAAYLLQRLTYSAKAPTGEEILSLATRGSAALLGRADLGSLEVGKAGDLFAVRTDRLELAGTLKDPANLLAVVGLNRPVDLTVVNGKVVFDGELKGIDEPRVTREVQQLLTSFGSS